MPTRRTAAGKRYFQDELPPAAIFVPRIDALLPEQVERLTGATLAVGQPECGRYSVLDAANKSKDGDRAADPSDIPLFTKLIAKFKPRYFIMDDLPKSLPAFPMSEYAARLPDYDLFPEWVSNYGYGNVQKNCRNRFASSSERSRASASPSCQGKTRSRARRSRT